MVSAGPGMSVRVSGHLVGSLVRDRDGGVRFRPDPAWLEGGQHPPLGLSFLQNPRPPVLRGWLPAWFENLLPEPGSALRTWLCQRYNHRQTDSVALLAQLGRDLPGAVEVLGCLDPEPPAESELDAEVAIDPPDAGRFRFSLAGMQLKLSMILSGERFSFPARGEDGRWIVKLPGRFPDLPEVEFATMSWARAAGHPVPRCHVLPVGNLEGVPPSLLAGPLQAFAVERFDRENGRRVHQEDFAQALGVLPGAKYGTELNHTAGYDGLALLVRDACGAEAQSEFIDRLAFVVASGNDDSHLKNWSFQLGHEHRPRLSPLYDQVATVTWQPEEEWRKGLTLALSLGRARRFEEIDRAALQRFEQRARAPNAEERFMSALERVRACWHVFAEHSPAHAVGALRRLWATVPLLREVGTLP